MRRIREVIGAILELGIFAAAVYFGITAQKTPTERETFAMIRYFDGSYDTVILQDYWISGGGSEVKMVTDAGRVVHMGINNVIIIEEDKE